MQSLSGPSFSPRSSAKPKHLVILLHGYGSNGEDLIELAPYFAEKLPEALFVAPHAPFPCELSSFGYQWFSLANLNPWARLEGVQVAAKILDAFLDAELARHEISESNLALVGFSQGTMMSLHVAPRRKPALAGVLGYSGALIAPEKLQSEIQSMPPVMLVHGTADTVVPFVAMEEAANALEGAGIAVSKHPRPGLLHSIDPTGIELGVQFLWERLAQS